jgi:hypothetical protein
MNENIIKILIELKENPNSEKVDHISILHCLYQEHRDGMTELKPVVNFYLNGFDDLPALREKHLWRTENYNEIMKPFFNSHSDLVKIVDKIVDDYKNRY